MHEYEEEVMLIRAILGLIGISFVLISGTDAVARVCLVKQGGSCVFWSGSVEAQLNATGAVESDILSVRFQGSPDPNDPTPDPVQGVLFCGNGGSKSNVAPGVNAAADAFGNFTIIDPQDCDKNGNCKVTIFAVPDLTGLDATCDDVLNPNWLAVDFVPCKDNSSIDMYAIVEEIDSSLVASTAVYSCNLPISVCTDLKWNKRLQRPERIQYDCQRIAVF
jgi:hypothetical protein